ncbi:valine--tRNA ligase [Rickettsiales bacterium]|nr:valine--tRNA ligase [Rickettsiales bacterium]MDB2550609.1 valine--tRNA ligase [Rickettsiales bacterium]
MTNLPKKYKHQEIESKWQEFWHQEKTYKWADDLPKEQNFVIDTPPPTVSGLLHMGHIFSYCQADFVARYKRMRGFDVFYPMGFDDNGLPTERLVEKTIGKKAVEMEKQEFIKECQNVVEKAEIQFEDLFNQIALSVDWDQKYQTISDKSQKLAQLSFIDLYNKNLVEKKFEPVFWDISDKTALAQADLVEKELAGQMNFINFGVENSEEKLEIMTTRPELLAACVAVMIHPDDDRYIKFHNKKAITPLFNVKVPIILDEDVKMDKGTGIVMCCTFGDEMDIKWWRKHNLDLKIILESNGRIKSAEKLEIDQKLGQEIEGLGIKQAKKKIIELLTENNLLNSQENITHAVKCAERSGVPIEILVQNQWFIKILDKKQELIDKINQCNWHPEYMKIRALQWCENLSWDWCISRQRFFGVNFPVWYSKRSGEEGKIILPKLADLPIDPNNDLPEGYSRDEITAETDIMDTWMTSSISPQLSSGGISDNLTDDNERHNKLFPADLRPQAHEIIRTWAFYTIVKAHLHQNIIPWQNLMISGWCLAADKTKMSKSKGNVVTPINLIKEKGSDIVRYWASTSNLGADTAYSDDVFKIGQKLVTKLFNAAKFASMNFDLLSEIGTPKTILSDIKDKNINQMTDFWILSRLQQVIKESEIEFDKFEYAKAREAVEDFFWNDFCDNYLEIVKVRAYGINAIKYQDQDLTKEQKNQIILEQKSAIYTLYHILEHILKLFAPFIPHITEEIYQGVFENKQKSIHQRNSWPKLEEQFFDENALNIGKEMLSVIFEVRKYKSEQNISMKTTIETFTINSQVNFEDILEDLKNVTNSNEITVNDDLQSNAKIHL